MRHHITAAQQQYPSYNRGTNSHPYQSAQCAVNCCLAAANTTAIQWQRYSISGQLLRFLLLAALLLLLLLLLLLFKLALPLPVRSGLNLFIFVLEGVHGRLPIAHSNVYTMQCLFQVVVCARCPELLVAGYVVRRPAQEYAPATCIPSETASSYPALPCEANQRCGGMGMKPTDQQHSKAVARWSWSCAVLFTLELPHTMYTTALHCCQRTTKKVALPWLLSRSVPEKVGMHMRP